MNKEENYKNSDVMRSLARQRRKLLSCQAAKLKLSRHCETQDNNIPCAERTVKNLLPYFPIPLLPSKRVAFTLAEVLITLGIIGVVASMTLPTLIQNYQKKQTLERLKTSKSILEQGFRKMLADEEVETLEDTEFFKSFPSEKPEILPDESRAVFNKYFKTILYIDNDKQKQDFQKKYYKKFSYWYVPQVYFANGSAVLFFGLTKHSVKSEYPCDTIKAQGGSYCSMMCDSWQCVRIDINGIKGPNVPGIDLFNFIITDNGILYPALEHNYSLFFTGTPDTPYYNYKYGPDSYCPTTGIPTKFGGNYSACAAKIIEDGWQINYNFAGAKRAEY